MSVKIFLAVSADGFVAAEDGNLDWLPSAELAQGESTGFEELTDSCYCLLMGRGTYDAVRQLNLWPYSLPVFVATHRPLDQDHPDNVFTVSGAPEGIITALSMGDIYLDGPSLIGQMLRQGLVDQATITQVPATIGQGIKLPDLGQGPRQAEEVGRRSIKLVDGSELEQIDYRLNS